MTIDSSKGSVALKIYDAKSGQIFGDGVTPTDFFLVKKGTAKNLVISILVVDKCYPMQWKLMEVTKWVRQKKYLKEARFNNNVQISVTSVSLCIWDKP